MNEEVIKNMTDLHREVFGDRYINPISNGDIRIITLLLEILKKCGKEEVSHVFKKYKTVSDKDIEEKLTRLSLNIPTKKLVGGFQCQLKGPLFCLEILIIPVSRYLRFSRGRKPRMKMGIRPYC